MKFPTFTLKQRRVTNIVLGLIGILIVLLLLLFRKHKPEFTLVSFGVVLSSIRLLSHGLLPFKISFNNSEYTFEMPSRRIINVIKWVGVVIMLIWFGFLMAS